MFANATPYPLSNPTQCVWCVARAQSPPPARASISSSNTPHAPHNAPPCPDPVSPLSNTPPMNNSTSIPYYADISTTARPQTATPNQSEEPQQTLYRKDTAWGCAPHHSLSPPQTHTLLQHCTTTPPLNITTPVRLSGTSHPRHPPQ